jgi:SnoaL-like domain
MAGMTGAGCSAAGWAEPVRAALESADVEAIGALLSPDVHWGPPEDRSSGCHNRKEVLRWYRRGRAAGQRAQVTELTVVGQRILVGLTIALDGTETERWQILEVGPDGVRDIRGYEDRASAAARLGG